MQIRAFKNDEARAIREQLEREAAAKRELEFAEEEKIARMREQEIRAEKLSLIHARRLPMPTQRLFVAELGSEFAKVFSALPPAIANPEITLSGSGATFKVGQLVESCRRRRCSGSVVHAATSPIQWHRCRITAIDEESRLVQLDFVDGDCERERRVPIKYVRPTAEGAQELRDDEFAALKSSWSQPILCEKEIARFEQARAIKLKPLPWDDRHHLTIPEAAKSGDVKPLEEAGQDRDTLRPGSAATTQRSSRSGRRPRSREGRTINRELDALFQAATVTLVEYDRAYARVREAVHSGAGRYAAAVLFRERFHAFDELAEALEVLMERSVDALEAVAQWRERASKQEDVPTTSFVWKGEDFERAFVRSLDFLGGYRELVEWYGEEFPLDANPFLLPQSLQEKAEDCGLVLPISTRATNSLRAALRLVKRDDDDRPATPSWWPSCHYSPALRRRIEKAEQVLLATLAGADPQRRSDQRPSAWDAAKT